MNLDRITEYLDTLPNEGIPSFDCIILKNHEEIYRHMSGTTDIKHTKKVQGNEQYLMYSMTKVQTMTAFMQLVEQGKISLEDPVGKYLPSYQNLWVEEDQKVVPLQSQLMVKHLLSMQSGLDYDLSRPGIKRVLQENGMSATTRQIVDSFVESPLKFVPGTHFLYSLSHDVAAAIIEVVSGMRFSDYLKKNIWEPLQMQHTFFARPRNDSVSDLAAQYEYDNEHHRSIPMDLSCCYQLSENYESGGAGLISSTIDYSIFADALACGGVGRDGTRIIKKETIELMSTNLLSDISRMDLERTMGRIGYGYGCGVQIMMDTKRAKTKAPVGLFGWDGAAGSCIFMDLKNQLSLVYMMHVRNCGYAYACLHPTLRNLMYED